jgi:hypothetical protein
LFSAGVHLLLDFQVFVTDNVRLLGMGVHEILVLMLLLKVVLMLLLVMEKFRVWVLLFGLLIVVGEFGCNHGGGSNWGHRIWWIHWVGDGGGVQSSDTVIEVLNDPQTSVLVDVVKELGYFGSTVAETGTETFGQINVGSDVQLVLLSECVQVFDRQL